MPPKTTIESVVSKYSLYTPGQRPMDIKIPYATQFGLERLAHYHDLNCTQMLAQLITRAHRDILSKLNDAQTDAYLHKRLRALNPSDAGRT